MMQQAGFSDAVLVAETGFNSSPKTKGVLLRAIKHNLQKMTSFSAYNHGGKRMGVLESNPKKENREPEA